MNFRDQIIEDIELIQENYMKGNQKLKNHDYAFNHWILSRLYSIDDEMVIHHVTEYSDDGVDCFVFFEDEKQLYLIQNKFYSSTRITEKYVQNEFLDRIITTLENNNYKRNEELQNIFNKYKNDSEFSVGLRLYISNNLKNESADKLIKKFQGKGDKVYYCDAKVYYLDDIKHNYFEERIVEKKNRYYFIKTINKNTIMEMKENYAFFNNISAKYVLTPVEEIFEILKDSKDNEHNIFSENIREFLGQKGINSKIAKTLEDKEDRSNFFFYNNGITIICEEIESEVLRKESHRNYRIKMKNPQIVNGCQTCNTIYEVLRKYHENDIKDNFRDTFVMTKILTIKNDDNNALREAIVRYNNSQNKIDEKHFEASKNIYQSLKQEFENRGLLLATKQSDQYQYKAKYKMDFDRFTTILQDRSMNFEVELKTLNDIIVPIEKFLQILVALFIGPMEAFQKKSHVLKPDSTINKRLIEIIKSEISIENMVDLYLLYIKSVKEKKSNEEDNSPIPYYLIGFIGNVFEHRNLKEVLTEVFKTKDTIIKIFKYFSILSDTYKDQMKNKGFEYNKMIKNPINPEVFQISKTSVDSILKEEKTYINSLFNDLI